MAGRIQSGFVVVAAAAVLAVSGGAALPVRAPLVSYSFDDEKIDAGPDTFTVFQTGRGAVSLSTLNRYSGYRAVELRDVPGDGTFPELQGYFPRRTGGKLYLHFALMTTDPAEEFNIALAGPQWFTLRKHGIGFWLKSAGGYLTAISDSMPKKLFRLRQFVWYVVDAAYDVEAGAYDLTIRQEGLAEPVFAVRGMANAPNQPGSHVDKFSFIGDHQTDESKVVYYVDDVFVGVDEPVAPPVSFAAPGRRKLFADYWNDAQRARARRPLPLPMMGLGDLGIGAAELELLRREQTAGLLPRLLSGALTTAPEQAGRGRSREILQPVIEWRAGDAALREGAAEMALAHYERASALAPAGVLFRMNAVMALAQLSQWEEVDRRLPALMAEWRGDSRLPVALVRIGMARQDLDGVERALRQGAEASGILAEQYFLTLLWRGETARAEAFAEAMRARSGAAASERALWQERLGDAAFFAGDVARALRQYEAALAGHGWPATVWSKLSDVHFKLGDMAKERDYRERVYGSLRGK